MVVVGDAITIITVIIGKNDEFYQDFDCNNSYNKDINMRLLRLALGFR